MKYKLSCYGVSDMADIEKLLEAVDHLSREELNILAKRIQEKQSERERNDPGLKVLSPDDLARIDEIMRPVQEEAAQMSEEEVFAAIDEAIDEVRRVRKSKHRN
jgi:hypothetical protein